MALGACNLTAVFRPDTHDVEIIVDCANMSKVTVKRSDLGGGFQSVRGMDNATVAPIGLFTGTDAECPNGYVTYAATAFDATTSANSQSIEVFVGHGPADTSGKPTTADWLFPLGILDRGMIVNVETFKQQVYAADREVVPVLGRRDPVAVHFGRHWFSGSLVLITLEDEDRATLEGILYDARVVVFCPREGAGYYQPLYFSVGDVTAERISAFALERSRRWTMDVQQIASPPAMYEVSPVGQTWDDVKADGETWSQKRIAGDTWRDLVGF